MTFGWFEKMLVWQLFLRVALPSLYFLDFSSTRPDADVPLVHRFQPA